MGDYAGAVAAIKSRLSDNWTTTRIVVANERPDDPWPPVNGDEEPEAFVLLETFVTGSEIRGVGQNAAGANQNIDFGLIYVHIFVPTGDGTETAYAYASTISALFRNTEFYQSAGFAVRTWRPRVDTGAKADIEGVPSGLYWRVTVTAEFEYIHID